MGATFDDLEKLQRSGRGLTTEELMAIEKANAQRKEQQAPMSPRSGMTTEELMALEAQSPNALTPEAAKSDFYSGLERGVKMPFQALKQMQLHSTSGAEQLAKEYDAKLQADELTSAGGVSSGVGEFLGASLPLSILGPLGGAQAGLGARALSLSAQGGLTGALMPVADGGENFGGSKAGQVALGAVLSPAIGMAPELALLPGRLTGKTLNALYGRASQTPAGQAGTQLSQDTGIHLTPGARSGSRILTFAENMARQSFDTADIARQADQKTGETLVNYIRRQTERLAPNSTDAEGLGLDLQGAVKGRFDAASDALEAKGDQDYSLVRALAGDKPMFRYDNTIAELRKIIAENEGVKGPTGSDYNKMAAQAKALLARFEPARPNVSDMPAPATGQARNIDKRTMLPTNEPPPDAEVVRRIDRTTMMPVYDRLEPPAPNEGAAAPRSGKGPSSPRDIDQTTMIPREEGLDTIDNALKTRSAWSKASRGGASLFEGMESNLGRKTAGRLVRALNADFDAAGQQPGPLGQAFREATQNYRNNSLEVEAIAKSPLGRKLGDRILYGNGTETNTVAPEKITGYLMKLPPSEIRQTVDMLAQHNPETLKQTQRYIIENALNEGQATTASMGLNTPPISGAKFARALPGKFEVREGRFVPSPEMQAFFANDPEALNQVGNTLQAIYRWGDRFGYNTSGTAPWAAFNEAIRAVTSLSMKAGATVAGKTMGMRQIAEAMSTPVGREVIINMSELSPKSRQFAKAAAALATLTAEQKAQGD